MKRKIFNLFSALMFVFLIGTDTYGQEQDKVELQEKDVQAMRCWFKSDRTEVRVGQTFIVTLTCQVTETEYERVVPKEESLEPSVVSLPPYEVIEGWRYPDIKRDIFRFFQYQYKLRIVGEEFFGQEVPLPELEIKYTVERSLNAEQSLDTRERTYVMPPLVVKVTSLVSKDAKDIRDPNYDNFQTVKVYERKAYVAFVVAGIIFTLPFLAFLFPAIRSLKKWRRSVSNGTGFSNASLLRRMKKELDRINQLRLAGNWDEESVGKVLSIVRIMGAIALFQQINQLSTRFESRGLLGQMKLRKGLFWPRKVLISSNLTPESAAADKHLLDKKWADDFVTVFSELNDIRYGKEIDVARVDQLFYMTLVLLKKIKFSNRWTVKKWSAFREMTKGWRPVWRTF